MLTDAYIKKYIVHYLNNEDYNLKQNNNIYNGIARVKFVFKHENKL